MTSNGWCNAQATCWREWLAWCRNVISATPRQLESLVRLSESLARLELQEEVAERHVTEALRLMKVSMQQSAMDHRTGMIDMDKLYSGVGALDREMRRHLATAISELLIGASPILCEHLSVRGDAYMRISFSGKETTVVTAPGPTRPFS